VHQEARPNPFVAFLASVCYVLGHIIADPVLTPGQAVSHYKIIRHIGGGGMGVVYEAEDIRLKRTVALKFLPPELSRDPDTKERFIQEAQAASALQHNNVCTVHEIDEADDGQMFIVMDLYDGQTLKKRIEDGGLKFEEAVEIAVQIAQGLAAAHERGILHRDIKPANVLLTAEGTVKIVDFGLAKLSGRSLMTMRGTTLGTAAYMSPETTRGEDAGVRGDIWSLGVVCYQMLSGRFPFGSEHEQAVIYSIQNAEPLPLGKNIPPECERIVRKALRKDPGERYQTMKELLTDLTAFRDNILSRNTGQLPASERPPRKLHLVIFAAGGVLLLAAAGAYVLFLRSPGVQNMASEPALRRLAVLPFSNLRSDPQTDFLGFALADQVIGHLAYVKTIIVRPSMAVRPFQGQSVDVASAAKTLNVDYLLTGSYLKESDIVRLSLELVDVRSNGILWRESIEESYVNAFKLEDLVSEKVVDGLRLRFSPEELRSMQADSSHSPKAYELFLRAISFPTTVQGSRLAADLLRQSVELDSTYAPAFNELGYRLQQLASYGQGEQRQIVAAEQGYKKALARNPGLLSAIAGLSGLYTDVGKTDEAFELAKRAIEINQNSAESHFFLGYLFRYVGLMDEGVREMEKAIALDPGNPRFRSIGITYTYRGEYEKALHGFDLDRDSPFSNVWKGYAYFRMGDTALALSYCNRVLMDGTESSFGVFAGSLQACILGHFDEGRALLRKRDTMPVIDGEQWYNTAEWDALFHDVPQCARALQKAIDGGFFNYPLMRSDPCLDPVRNDPAIQKTLEEAKTKRDAFIAKFNLNPGVG